MWEDPWTEDERKEKEAQHMQDIEEMINGGEEKIVLESFWSGHGEPKLAAIYYRGERRLGREVVASKGDALLNAEALYGFTIETTIVDER